ncbi:MAG: hypothetical protein R2839_02285 [Thermomicrobiales bacterium]
MSEADVAMRLAGPSPPSSPKLEVVDVIIDNSGDRDTTRQEVARALERIMANRQSAIT